MKPEFPLTVTFLANDENPEEWKLLLEDEVTACKQLEWFDSDDPKHNAIVHDKLERKVKLKIEELKVLSCELYDK